MIIREQFAPLFFAQINQDLGLQRAGYRRGNWQKEQIRLLLLKYIFPTKKLLNPKQFMKTRFILKSWQDYWKLFDTLIELLKADGKESIASDFLETQKYVTGLTDGWHDYKNAFEKSLLTNKPSMTSEELQIAKFLLSSIKESLRGR